MPSNTVVRARIDGQIKEEAAAVLDAMGLTVSDAFRMLLTRIAKERALPFEPLVPNEETIQAMQEARAGRVRTAKSADDLIAQLNATGTGRFSQTVFMIGSMQINKSFKCVLLSAKIKPFLQSGKPQNTRSNQVFLLHGFFAIPIR